VLVNLLSAEVLFWGPLRVLTSICALPRVVMFLIFQRWVVKGLTLGAVKG